MTAIQQQNVVAPVGRIGARPIGKDQQFQFNLQTQGRLVTPAEFGNIVIRANPDGSVLRLRDVAKVQLGAQNMDSETRLNGQPAVPVAIYLAPGANAVNTSALVRKALQRLSERFPAGLHARVMYDTSEFVSDTVHEVITTLLEAFGLVVLVVFLFLGSIARHHHPGGRRAGEPDRHLRGAAGAGVHRQHGVAAGDGAGDRHRGR